MQRLLVACVAASLIAGVALFSGRGNTTGESKATEPEIVVRSLGTTVSKNSAPEEIVAEPGEVNPWTSLKVNKDPRDFQFAIVTDRTGGHRPGVFAQAVEKLNLLQPEFVLSVGDLIEGYSRDPAQWALEWSEFQGKIDRLEAPFFYTAGNHDIANPDMAKNWDRKFGRRYYNFVYQDVLFVMLLSEDPPGELPEFGRTQLAWLADVLQQHQKVRWTFVLVHKPGWYFSNVQKGGWGEVERLLANRPHTVFAGHVHNYAHAKRNNGRDYIMLGTTGGASQLRGKEYGEVDHVVWVTMKGSAPIIANLFVEGIQDKEFRSLPSHPPK